MSKINKHGSNNDGRVCNNSTPMDSSRANAKSSSKTQNPRKPRRRSTSNPAINTDSIESNGKVMNNPNYYFTDPTLAAQATSISFNTFLGTEDRYSGGGAYGLNHTPTVMAINLNPTAGPMDPLYSAASGINMAGRKLYNRLSSINAKTTNYAPQDLITLMLALGSVLEYVSFIRRCFGLAFTTSYRNRFVPKEIIKIMGLDADDFFKNIAAYRLEFNTLINLLQKVPFPANVAYFEKCATMYDHVWTDSEDMAIAQLYVFMPYSVWKFNEAYSEQGSGLNTVELNAIPAQAKPMSNYLDILSQMIEALVTSSTLNFVYADILNLAAKENIPLYQVQFLPENYVVLPEYNAEALLQIHNMSIVGYPNATTAPTGVTHFTKQNDVVPNVNKNEVEYYPVYYQTSASLCAQKFIDFPSGQPDVAQIIEATRYVALAKDYALETVGKTTMYRMTDVAVGDHVVISFVIYYSEGKSAESPYIASSALSTNDVYKTLAALSKFDWAPIMYAYDPQTPAKFIDVFGDLNYYTLVDRNYINRVDDLAMMALFELR